MKRTAENEGDIKEWKKAVRCIPSPAAEGPKGREEIVTGGESGVCGLDGSI